MIIIIIIIIRCGFLTELLDLRYNSFEASSLVSEGNEMALFEQVAVSDGLRSTKRGRWENGTRFLSTHILR